MAVLKYKNEQGQFVTLTNYTIQPIVPVQTTGSSMTDIMSQKAVTDGLAAKVDNSELNDKIEDSIKNDQGVKEALDDKISNAIENDDTVISAITKIISEDDAVSGMVETIVSNKLTAYTDTEELTELLNGKSDSGHKHQYNDINDFNDGVSNAVSTNGDVINAVTNIVSSSITNSQEVISSITQVISSNTEVEKSVNNVISAFTNDVLDERYAKSNDIPTDLSAFTNSPGYVKESQVNGLVASAITENQAVIDAVNSAITSAITSDTAVQNAIDTATSNKFGEVEYDSDSKRINFYATSAKTSVIDYIDATDFIKDGMVDNVTISGSNLVITFNTDAGKEDISLSLTDIFNPDNYFTRDELSGSSSTVVVRNAYSSTTAASAESVSATNVNGLSDAISNAVSSNTEVINSITKVIEEDSSVNGAVEAIVSGYTYDKNSIDNKISSQTYASSAITSMSGYEKATSASNISTSDSLNVAIGKLERKVDDAVAGGVSSVSLGSGSTNGSLTLTVNGELQNTISVPGLGDAAFLNTGTTEGTVAAGNHTHDYSEVYQAKGDYAPLVHTHESSAITDFSPTVENIVSSSTTIETRVEAIITSAITDNASVSGAIESAVESNSAVTASKSFTDFYTGSNTGLTSLTNIPTTKRLVVIETSSASNTFSLSGNTLPDGYEIHVFVKNNSGSEATVTVSGSQYILLGDPITIGIGKYGEINVISDGTKLYVRGA